MKSFLAPPNDNPLIARCKAALPKSVLLNQTEKSVNWSQRSSGNEVS